MKRALLLLALAACNKPDTQTTTSAASASASSQAPPAPFAGALTGDRVMGAKNLVHPFDKWDAAQAKLEGQMGKETLAKGDKHMWGVSQGDDCFYMVVEKQKDGTVGMVQDPSKVSKGGAIMNWDECLTAAGVRKEAVEDPNAPGPPTDGKPITLVALVDGAKAARSKWSGAKLTVTAFNSGTSTSTSGSSSSTTISLGAGKGDSAHRSSCNLADPKAALPKSVLGDPITVSGTVKVYEMMSLGSGERSLGVDLADCSVVKGK